MSVQKSGWKSDITSANIKIPPSSKTSETYQKIFPDSNGTDRSTTLTNRKYNRNVDYLDQQAQIWNNKWKRPGGSDMGTMNTGIDVGQGPN
jgi:hypothetical protein